MNDVTETDVIVVGSGAGGGMAAYALTLHGIKVLMLEAGRDYDPETETPMFQSLHEAPLRASGTPDKEAGYFDATVNGGWNVPGEPYTVAEGSKFKWWRARMLGGRTNHWGRLSYRFGEHDFKGRSKRDGLGHDWPFGYDEIAPYYDRVERLVGIFGAAEGIANNPDSPPGVLLPPPRPRGAETWLQMAVARQVNMPIVPAHKAILTQAHNGRPACLYATPCGRGCSIGANFQSPTVLLPPARKTGKLTIRTGAMVYEVAVDRAGKATGVRYIDVATGRHVEVKARAVVLAASACETARIMLQSKSPQHRDGIANGSGQVGRNLTDTVDIGVTAHVPQLMDQPAYNDEGVVGMHVYSPWWLFEAQKAGKLDFPRGYQIEYYTGRLRPDMDAVGKLVDTVDLHGASMHRELPRWYGSFVTMKSRGEMLPNANSYCELDPDVKDRFGLPVLRFHFQRSDYERAQARHAKQAFTDMLEAIGAKVEPSGYDRIEDEMAVGGEIIHELGTARMGESPKDSVLNGYARAWDVPNLYVVDGAAFASNPEKNPTETIMAVAWRAMDHLKASFDRGEA